MNQFVHTADSRIIINNTEFTLAQFLLFEPAYTLPTSFERRTYIQGISHILYDEDGFIYQDLGTTWAEGDLYISKLDDYIAGGVSPALNIFITLYLDVLGNYNASSINDPELIEDSAKSLISSAVDLPPLDKISLEDQYPEFANIDSILFSNALRDKIVILLNNTDWTQLSDAGLSTQSLNDWTSYRQDLRLLGSQTGLSKITEVSMPLAPGNPTNRF